MPRVNLFAKPDQAGTPPRRRRRRQRGQSMVEFALIFPLFLVLVMGIIDFGWALRSYITLTNAAREGARLAVVGCTTTAQEDAVKARVVDFASSLNPDPTVTVTPTCTSTGPKAGAEVAIKAEYDYTFITPLGSLLKIVSTTSTLGSSLHLSTTTKMRTE